MPLDLFQLQPSGSFYALNSGCTDFPGVPEVSDWWLIASLMCDRVQSESAVGGIWDMLVA
ncbi:hypothetical protein [[Phormidium] sp. ETS-05]|uniref:hypothetical protein n=1 Tax=[Phormidium] sp. ETS-05 TaxID=222819 RepID=UPI0018EEFAE8|nr:hypothetical protein [[Phormidium] sp. ETS-05]